MAVPKKRTSKTKKNQRRAQKKAKAPHFVDCPRCREKKLPHRVCLSCGHYRGEEVIET